MILSALKKHFQSNWPDGLVLLTRPFQDSLTDAHELETIGLRTLIEPMLEIYPILQNNESFKDTKCVITTSANAIKMIHPFMENNLNIPLWCVGSASANVAKNLGFQDINFPATPNAKELIKDFLKKSYDKNQSITYASGDYVSVPIDDILKSKGYHVERVIVYQSIYIDHFRAHVKKAFDNKEIKFAVFYSQNCLKTFNYICNSQDINKNDFVVICISEEIGKLASSLGFYEILIFDKKRKKFTNFLLDYSLQ